jgi:2-C-methyl-D-erythritol 2,4-cyclodiphosphate synthase
MIRTGIGYDSHRFFEGRPLILGGVAIPHTHGLVGHSDADAVCHALTDAILGAAAAGDIGKLFPDSDIRWKGSDSIQLLHRAHAVVLAKGWRFLQGDITVICEHPRLGPHFAAMAEKLALALDVSPEVIGLKAKTNEGMGWIGRGEGVATLAVATLERLP